MLAAHQPGAVLIDALDGDGLLNAAGYLEFVPLALVGGNQGFNQSRPPPFGQAYCSRSFRKQSAGLRRIGAPI